MSFIVWKNWQSLQMLAEFARLRECLWSQHSKFLEKLLFYFIFSCILMTGHPFSKTEGCSLGTVQNRRRVKVTHCSLLTVIFLEKNPKTTQTFITHVSTVRLRPVNYYGDIRTSRNFIHQTKRWRRCMFLFFFLRFKTNCKKNCRK